MDPGKSLALLRFEKPFLKSTRALQAIPMLIWSGKRGINSRAPNREETAWLTPGFYPVLLAPYFSVLMAGVKNLFD